MNVSVMTDSKQQIADTRILVSGFDISTDCFKADNDENYLMLFKLNKGGFRFADGDGVASIRINYPVDIIRNG